MVDLKESEYIRTRENIYKLTCKTKGKKNKYLHNYIMRVKKDFLKMY